MIPEKYAGTSVPDNAFGERVRARLDSEEVIWLTTVGADGTPQPNPVWFLWQDDGFLIYNRESAKRLAHIAVRPEVSLSFDSNGGHDVVVFTGRARRLDNQPMPHELPPYLEKYGDAMVYIGGSHEKFGHLQPIAIRVDVRRLRGF